MAALGNLGIGVLSRAGPVNLAAALRRHARNPRRPSPPSGSALDETDTTTQRRSLGTALMPWVSRTAVPALAIQLCRRTVS
jgi:hypothetical protein